MLQQFTSPLNGIGHFPITLSDFLDPFTEGDHCPVGILIRQHSRCYAWLREISPDSANQGVPLGGSHGALFLSAQSVLARDKKRRFPSDDSLILLEQVESLRWFRFRLLQSFLPHQEYGSLTFIRH